MPLRFAGPLLAALLAASAGAHPGHVHFRPLPQDQVKAAQEEMGRCVGREPGAPPRVTQGAPFDLKAAPLAPEERELWEKLDYRVDEKAGRLLNPDGTPVPAAEVDRLRAPFDSAREEMDANLWTYLMTSGLRLDEKTCAVKDPAGNVLSRLALHLWEGNLKNSYRHSALEDLSAGLAKLKPGEAVPASLRERAALLEKQGMGLPPAVKKALQEAATVGDLSSVVDGAYARSTRLFDQGGWYAPLAAAAPTIRGLNTAPLAPTYADDPERHLGAALNADIAAVLGEHPTGRELLERFKSKDGKLDLPAALVLKLSQRPGDAGYGQAGAVASPDGAFVALNFWVARGAALTSVPEAQRAALAKRLATPEAQQDWLLKNAVQRREFVRGLDSTFLHELTHAWQARRGRFEVEMLRGNAPSINPLEKEHEAFRAEMRLFHDKLKANPAAAVASPEFTTFQQIVADYGQYKDGITRLYMENFPGSSDFPTAGKLQDERRRISEVIGRSSVAEWGRQTLRRLGFKRGDEAVRVDAEDYRSREKTFTDVELPRMRREASATLVSHFKASDRPALALGAARLRGSESTKADRLDLLDKALAQLRKPGGDPERRVQDISQVGGYLMEREAEWPADFSALQKAGFQDAARLYLGRADKASGAERAHWLEWAEAYAKNAADKDLEAQVARRREKAKK